MVNLELLNSELEKRLGTFKTDALLSEDQMTKLFEVIKSEVLQYCALQGIGVTEVDLQYCPNGSVIVHLGVKPEKIKPAHVTMRARAIHGGE